MLRSVNISLSATGSPFPERVTVLGYLVNKRGMITSHLYSSDPTHWDDLSPLLSMAKKSKAEAAFRLPSGFEVSLGMHRMTLDIPEDFDLR